MTIKLALPRKIITAAISSCLFAILFGVISIISFGGIDSILDLFEAFFLSAVVSLIYSYPVNLLYGTISSTFSDFIAYLISKYTNKKLELYIAAVIHLLFGSLLLIIEPSFFWIGLIASALFFVTDKYLSKRNTYKWRQAFKSLGIPIMGWIILMGMVYIINLIKDTFFG